MKIEPLHLTPPVDQKLTPTRLRRRGGSSSSTLDKARNYNTHRSEEGIREEAWCRGRSDVREEVGNLGGDFKKIREYEGGICGKSESFWCLRGDLRRVKGLPGFFYKEVYDILVGGGGGGGFGSEGGFKGEGGFSGNGGFDGEGGFNGNGGSGGFNGNGGFGGNDGFGSEGGFKGEDGNGGLGGEAGKVVNGGFGGDGNNGEGGYGCNGSFGGKGGFGGGDGFGGKDGIGRKGGFGVEGGFGGNGDFECEGGNGGGLGGNGNFGGEDGLGRGGGGFGGKGGCVGGGGIGGDEGGVNGKGLVLDLDSDGVSMEVEPESVFDSGRRRSGEDGLFSHFESGLNGGGSVRRDFQVAKGVVLPSRGIPAPTPISIGTGNAKEPALDERLGSTQGGKKRKRYTPEEDEDAIQWQQHLIKALERNGNLLSSQLEVQNNRYQLEREQQKDHASNLVAVLSKVADALGKIADKL
ncbi:hypothetical protein Leryth_023126 [Lithospermum erythrorhizon]|nr:hypothetical protein Leryth_023126 [Lithospermum erythrorhizon]